MIITDPSKRPSERLLQTISDYFLLRGFTYKKSLNQFERKVGKRKEMVSIFYNKTINLVSAFLTWAILFPDLEKVYKTIDTQDIRGVAPSTLWTTLDNYLRSIGSNDKTAYELYDKDSFRYDDFSINAAGNNVIKSYEKYIEPFFEHYKNTNTLEKEMNRLPIQYHPFIGYGGRHIVLGLTLGKLYDKEGFSALADNYRQYITIQENEVDFKRKMEAYLDNTIKHWTSVNIDDVISI